MKNPITAVKRKIEKHKILLSTTTGIAIGSVATAMILRKSHLLDPKDITWYAYASRDDIADVIKKHGHVILDCYADNCDRTLTLIVDPLKQ